MLDWDEKTESGQRARAKYTRQSGDYTGRKEKSLQIFDTDYHSYAVGVSCLENEAGDQHKKDYSVWMRYK